MDWFDSGTDFIMHYVRLHINVTVLHDNYVLQYVTMGNLLLL